MTRLLAEELKEYNIQINAINPGVMDTSIIHVTAVCMCLSLKKIDPIPIWMIPSGT